MSYADIDTTNWTPGTTYWTRITDDNHAGWLYIVTLLSFVYVLIAFAIRFVIKWGMYGLDDWALLGSTVLAVAQYVAILVALSKGLGKSSFLLGQARMKELALYASAHAYLYILAHCFSKTSTALLTLRLFENGRSRNRYMSWALVLAAAIFGLAGVLSVSVSCENIYMPTCPHKYTRWQIIMAVDIITETLLILVPTILILDILIDRTAKITVLAVFGFRLVDVVFAAMNLHEISILGHAADHALAVVPSLILTQTELLWSILASSLPCLKAFTRPFEKIDEDTWRSKNGMYASGRTARACGDRSVRDDSMVHGSAKPRLRHEAPTASGSDCTGLDFGLRADNVSHEVEISHSTSDVESNERKSWGSQEHIVKTHTRFEVKREGGRDPYEIP